MNITSLQACMDSSDWLQGAMSDDNTGLLMDSSPTVDDNLPCSGPLVHRRLRPNHEQPLKCPRCESTHTKFCYYNNYNLTQPRYFCKTCRRYWTKGGTLRNIPVGGGCRKNKKVSSNSKKPSSDQNINLHHPSPPLLSSPLTLDQSQTTTDLHLAFPEQLRFSAIHGAGSFNPANTGFFFENMIPNPVECMGMENTVHENFHGNAYNNMDHHPFGLSSFEHGIGNPGGGTHHILESYQRLMLPYDENNHHHYHLDQNHQFHHHEVDVKPNAKILSLEWHDCNSDAGIKDQFGYNLGGLGSWTGLMSGYGSSATNPLV